MKIPKTYFYDPNDLAMKPLSNWKLILYTILAITFLSSISFIYGRITKITNLSDLEKEILIVERELLKLSAELDDEGTNAFLSDLIKEKEKINWMLSAWSVKQTELVF